jgi:thiamine kinase-like enzyme
MKKKYHIKEIANQFKFEGDYIKGEELGAGHINDTFTVEYRNYSGENIKYILQRINQYVFKHPDGIMRNIELITTHIRNNIEVAGGNPFRETLNIIKAKDDKTYYFDGENYWRGYNYIEDTTTYQRLEEGEHKLFFNVGKTFGHFQHQLQDFPVDVLHESIVDFHNTEKRYENLNTAISNNKMNRIITAQQEIDYAKSCYESLSDILSKIRNEEFPIRVTHNDTKLNNILIDNTTNEGICVIDLDTVMPGTVLYDFGDCIRFGASTALEDEQDLSMVRMDLSLFEHFTSGFLSSTIDFLEEIEIEYIPMSCKLLTFECGIRFLEDYLNGDQYFKIDHNRPQHNLDRARTQFKLVQDMDEKMDDMKAIVKKYVELYREN